MCSCDFLSIAPGAEYENEVLTQEIAPHSREFASLGWKAWSNAPRYSPGMGVRGFPLTSALIPQ